MEISLEALLMGIFFHKLSVSVLTTAGSNLALAFSRTQRIEVKWSHELNETQCSDFTNFSHELANSETSNKANTPQGIQQRE